MLAGCVWQSNDQCDQTVALTQFFEDIVWSSPPKVAFIGGGCDDSTIQTAKISYLFNLTQVGMLHPLIMLHPLTI